ncbi:MAG: hypothetical protein Fur0022_14220 [Anaerolineales bacterium]
MTTELIDRYIHEVGQHLPRRMRADVQMELRSSIQDSLDEQDGEGEDCVAAVLQAFGPPEEVAARYLPERTLVGPQLFPSYTFSLLVAGIIITAGTVLGIVLDVGDGLPKGTLAWWGEVMAQYVHYLIFNFGLVTAIFAALQWFGVGKTAPSKVAWDPRTLPEIKDPYRINRNEMMFGIGFTIAVILLFNFFPQWVGLIGFHDGGWGVIPLLSDEFQVHVPWLTVLWGAEIILWVFVLQRGAWQKITQVAELGLSIAGILMLYRIIALGGISSIPALESLIQFGLNIILAISILSALGKLYHVIFDRAVSLGWMMKSQAIH